MVAENMYRIVWIDKQNLRNTSYYLGDTEETATRKFKRDFGQYVSAVMLIAQVPQDQLDALCGNQPKEPRP